MITNIASSVEVNEHDEQSGQESAGAVSMGAEGQRGPGSKRKLGRRSFVKSLALGGAGASLLRSGTALADGSRSSGLGSITSGDAAILRFLAAAEILETDLWV